ncbi:hypothetical protein BKI52_25105 [marine bacterium AO1-C]|nr:hypothetical protein BKI52_25105 [marine bacterium AO1-C]
MKKLTFLLVLIWIPFMSQAQNNEGRIIYATKMKMQIPERFKRMISKEQLEKMQNRVITHQLLFNASETMYKTYEDPNKEVDPKERRGFMSFGRNDNQMYYNTSKQEIVEQRSFLGRKFLIKDKPKQHKWKLSAETKKIQGYDCRKATLEEEKRTLEAWFTMQIPVPSGPQGYGQLPGLILEMKSSSKSEKGNGKFEATTTASKIEFKKLEADAIKAPKKGKKVTRKQFNKIVKEKMQEMREQRRSKGKF